MQTGIIQTFTIESIEFFVVVNSSELTKYRESRASKVALVHDRRLLDLRHNKTKSIESIKKNYLYTMNYKVVRNLSSDYLELLRPSNLLTFSPSKTPSI